MPDRFFRADFRKANITSGRGRRIGNKNAAEGGPRALLREICLKSSPKDWKSQMPLLPNNRSQSGWRRMIFRDLRGAQNLPSYNRKGRSSDQRTPGQFPPHRHPCWCAKRLVCCSRSLVHRKAHRSRPAHQCRLCAFSLKQRLAVRSLSPVALLLHVDRSSVISCLVVQLPQRMGQREVGGTTPRASQFFDGSAVLMHGELAVNAYRNLVVDELPEASDRAVLFPLISSL